MLLATSRRFALLAAAVGLGLFVLFLGAWAIDSAVLSGQVARNVRLDGAGVGGLSDTDLRAKVSEIAADYEQQTVHLTTPSGGVDTTLTDLGVAVDQQATVRDALAVGRDDALLMRPFRWAASLSSPRRAPVRFTVNPPMVAAKIAALEADNLTEPIEPSLQVEDGTVVVVPGQPGRSFDTRALADQLEAEATSGQRDIRLDVISLDVAPHTSDAEMATLADEANRITAAPLDLSVGPAVGAVHASAPPALVRSWLVAIPPSTDVSAEPVATLAIDRARAAADITALMASLGTPVGVPPTEVTWTVGPGNKPAFIGGEPGTGCCTPETLDAILTSLRSGTKTAALALVATPPVHDAAWAQKLGIVQQTASFTTNHPAGQARVVNIHRIADLVRGMVIEPGQTWSLNGSVGKRTVEKGFVEAPVIYNGEHDSDIGGGVSQFATTTFNAAFFGGLDFVEYQSHSLYISRYPYGREATVSWEQPDLKIKNSTPYGILIWPTYTSGSLTVTLYSTPWVIGEQTGQTRQPQGPCTKVTTQRTRTWASDGHQDVDTVFATYRPAEGVKC